jgi:hypothetical protein
MGINKNEQIVTSVGKVGRWNRWEGKGIGVRGIEKKRVIRESVSGRERGGRTRVEWSLTKRFPAAVRLCVEAGQLPTTSRGELMEN